MLLVERFRYDDKNVFTVAPLERLSFLAILGAMGLGFSLSLLFFMDQNITSAMVNNPCNKYVSSVSRLSQFFARRRTSGGHLVTMTLLIQAEKRSGLSLGSVRRGHGDGFPVYLRPSVDARHPAALAAARARPGRRRGARRPGTRLRDVTHCRHRFRRISLSSPRCLAS